jgi:hypothetical protein
MLEAALSARAAPLLEVEAHARAWPSAAVAAVAAAIATVAPAVTTIPATATRRRRRRRQRRWRGWPREGDGDAPAVDLRTVHVQYGSLGLLSRGVLDACEAFGQVHLPWAQRARKVAKQP